MSASDTEYFRTRVAAEEALARAADNERTAKVHKQLARKYQTMIDFAKAACAQEVSAAQSQAQA